MSLFLANKIEFPGRTLLTYLINIYCMNVADIFIKIEENKPSDLVLLSIR